MEKPNRSALAFLLGFVFAYKGLDLIWHGVYIALIAVAYYLGHHVALS